MRISRDRMAGWSTTYGQNRLSALIPERDYKGMNQQDAQLRIWLPEPARVGLEQVCERMEISMTMYLSEFFVTYLYGYHELLRMRENQLGLYEPVERRLGSAMWTEEPGEPEPKEPNLGKNIFALKLFVPEKLKVDLQARATRASVTLGEFARSLICTHLFGREYGPRAFQSWPETEVQAARAWEEDCA